MVWNGWSCGAGTGRILFHLAAKVAASRWLVRVENRVG